MFNKKQNCLRITYSYYAFNFNCELTSNPNITIPVWNTQKTYELNYDVAKFDMREHCSDADTKFDDLVFSVNNDISPSKGDLELDDYILRVDVTSGPMPSGTYKTSITVSDGTHEIGSPVFSYEYSKKNNFSILLTCIGSV